MHEPLRTAQVEDLKVKGVRTGRFSRRLNLLFVEAFRNSKITRSWWELRPNVFGARSVGERETKVPERRGGA